MPGGRRNILDKIRVGLLKRVTKYKPIWCTHGDWLIMKTLGKRLNCTMLKLQHDLIHTFITCKEQNHEKQIDDLADKVDILAAEVLKYRNRYGIIKD